jgi:hypothetical protein
MQYRIISEMPIIDKVCRILTVYSRSKICQILQINELVTGRRPPPTGDIDEKKRPNVSVAKCNFSPNNTHFVNLAPDGALPYLTRRPIAL